ncbi:TonB-dependent receptor [Stenotrophomonas sp. C3(2023)]|uniref:TonB-dependent receptor n=1 Tax=Stenotrophomonas sp. C3(2023) TaxID=3080277 RepID=UPI00293CC13E|nr:TonB-dependent receptor [Stenotrophomonas sp. C3(2023)]MDV3467204.1 TonB-dependent receptor [Stenotrophomonas sp. C3(2023)]
MQVRNSSKKTPVTMLALSIGLALSAAANAQDASGQSATDLDTITVTGYRASVEKALDIKRGEAGVVDAIVAEDVGKFPDLNLAESLQRIPGVVITREAGEGRNISVRGLGADFTRVRINGMEALTTVGAGDQSGGTNRGRGFDFNVFASDLFSQMLVRKTASADVEEGSLGATVDLRTARPFDYDGFTFAASGQASYNDMAEKADPRMSALISNTFADGRFGALLSAAYSERQALEEGSNTGRWAGGTSNGGFAASPAFPDARRADVYHPRFPRYVQMEHEQKRLGVTGSLQWKPTDSTEISLDALYSKIDATRDENYIEAISFSRNRDSGTGANRRPERDGKPATVVTAGEIRNNALVYGQFDNVDIRSESRHDEWNTEFKQVGLNFDHRFNDAFSVNAKVGLSRSAHENPVQTTLIMDKYDVDGYSYDYRGNSRMPVLNYGVDPTDPNGWELAEIRLRPQYVDNDYDTAEVNFNWNISPGFRLKGGVQSKDYTFSTLELRRSSEGAVPLLPNGTRILPGDLTTGAGLKGIAGSPSNWVVPDLNAIADLLDIYNNTGTFAVAPRSNNSRGVEEKGRGGWLMGEFSTDLGSIPLSGNFGVRYVETKQRSTGFATVAGALVPAVSNRKYDDTLPSFNLVAEITPDFLVRLGAAKVMSRPGLGNLTPGVTVAVAGGARTVSGGNPALDPYRATNVDMSFEWYFAEGAMAGIGLFYKDIDSFVQTARETRPYSSSGLPASLLDGTGATVNDDFTFSAPLNTPGGELYGVEANYTQPFTFLPGKWSNLGMQLNYTWVDTSIQYVNSSGVATMKNQLTGTSKNAWNATLFYEGETWSGRVSATNRSDYLTVVTGQEAGFNTDGYHGMTGTTVIDASLRYRISDQLELTLEGINLSNEGSDEWVYSPATGQLPLQYTETGRQFMLGARYKF